jgi:hypothetical protein
MPHGYKPGLLYKERAEVFRTEAIREILLRGRIAFSSHYPEPYSPFVPAQN